MYIVFQFVSPPVFLFVLMKKNKAKERNPFLPRDVTYRQTYDCYKRPLRRLLSFIPVDSLFPPSQSRANPAVLRLPDPLQF